jgi:hypothetical protein
MSSRTGKSAERLIDVGPTGFHPPWAMQLGVTHPDSGFGLLYGHRAPEDEVIAESARQLFTRKSPTIFPGPYRTGARAWR